MKPYSFLAAFALAAAFACPVQAACYADYKAKQENPLKLHYGVVQVDISPCVMSENVRSSVADRLRSAGWQLLQVQSVFDDSGLGKRKRDAGQFFLRF
ncbi:MAG: hypothetical protein LJE62_13580 [Silicimonas sp.]|nr:hypothetical protein [Silicimonas sp.]